jgi:hypothetical protein
MLKFHFGIAEASDGRVGQARFSKIVCYLGDNSIDCRLSVLGREVNKKESPRSQPTGETR